MLALSGSFFIFLLCKCYEDFVGFAFERVSFCVSIYNQVKKEGLKIDLTFM